MCGLHGGSATSDLLLWGESELRRASVDTPRLESQVLLACAAGVRRDDVSAGLVKSVEPAIADRFRRLIGRRSERVPLAYLRGFQEFYGLTIEVDPSTLVPRPETELLVDAALHAIDDHGAPARVVDVCTGSGCVAIALATRRDAATIWASDVSVHALSMARRNVERHVALGRVDLVCSDLLRGFARRSCDVVTANPPYIASDVIPRLQPEIALHEPRKALDGGADGMDYLRRLIAESWIVLRPAGWLLLEVGAGQASIVSGHMKDAGYRSIRVERDLAGIERVVGGVKPV